MVEEQIEDRIDEGQWTLVASLIVDYNGITDLYMFAKENTGHQGLLVPVIAVNF